ncbi:MAG: hypothetical protein EZS28_031817 [Streblomastix strix]|uniref:Uncharacterized protein n=1 Tax=Streblomastix strix TaxID=222440 RepID=A0A5J4UQH2_9EUKA|nr:MAG: hypothetical protein EZS28_031817 [Streblomastix strix]
MSFRTKQQEYTVMCLFKDIYDKSLAVEVAVSGVLNKYDCEFQRTYILDNYKNPTSNEEPNASPLDPNASPLNPQEPDSHIDEGGHAYNIFYIVDDGSCKVCVFNLYFETKGQATSAQEIGRVPDAILPADGKTGIFNKLKKLISVVGKGVSWMNDKVVKPIMSITIALLSSLGPAGSMVAKAISVGSSAVDALFGPNKQQSKQPFRQDFKTFRQDNYLRKNIPIDIISNLENLLKTFAIQSFQNYGQHHFSIKEIKPESQMPSLFDKEVIISLTDPDHGVTQMQNSFLTLDFKMNLLFDNKFDQFSESYRARTFIFVGLKSSAQLIREYVLYHRGKTINGSIKNDSTTEQFIYNIIKPKSEKNNNRFVDSLYENVRKDDISHCGKYLSIKDIFEVLALQTAAPYVMPVNFSVSIPLDDLLIFSAFSEYPNALFGNLKIKFKINPYAFVF